MFRAYHENDLGSLPPGEKMIVNLHMSLKKHFYNEYFVTNGFIVAIFIIKNLRYNEKTVFLPQR